MDSIMIFGTRDLAMSGSFGEWIAVEQRKPVQSLLGTANRARQCTAVGADVPTTHPLLTSAAEP
ncbi:MAG: hypothetical protein M3R63_25935 [Actinomycetota bacterium]|nr:hypothetical protein [Actinomycetota bacterium]